MVEQLRSLIAEGTPGKALNLLLSKGLHSVSDPAVRAALDELHPPGRPVDHSQFPGAVMTGLPDPMDRDIWASAVLKAVADFPRGSAQDHQSSDPDACTNC